MVEKDYALWHLQEAKEELDRTIKALAADPEYGEEEFRVAIEHLYNHVNTAWNARNASPERTAVCSEADFKTWRHFPTDIDMGDA